jgi:hypothetical protein
MAYQTGSATSNLDLIQQLVSWLVTQGWTSDDSQADGSGWRAHLHKSGNYLHLKTLPTGTPFNGYLGTCSVPGLWCYMSTAYAGIGSNWYSSLTGAPLGIDGKVCGTGIVVNTGANYAYHFFHDGSDHYTIVVARDAGLFNVMGFGLAPLKHGGSWTGGPFIHGQICGGNTSNNPIDDNSYCPFHYGTNEVTYGNSAFLRADVDTFTGNWVCIGPHTDSGRAGWTGRQAHSTVKGKTALPAAIPHTDELVSYLTNSVNTQAVLLPIRIYVEKSEGGPCLLATMPAVYQTNAVGKGYLAGDEYAIGADTFMLFPNFAVKKVS